MGHRSDYLKRVSRYPEQVLEERKGWLSRSAPERKPSAAQIAGLAVLAMGVVAGIYFGADLLRYIQMKRM